MTPCMPTRGAAKPSTRTLVDSADSQLADARTRLGRSLAQRAGRRPPSSSRFARAMKRLGARPPPGCDRRS